MRRIVKIWRSLFRKKFWFPGRKFKEFKSKESENFKEYYLYIIQILHTQFIFASKKGLIKIVFTFLSQKPLLFDWNTRNKFMFYIYILHVNVIRKTYFNFKTKINCR